MKNEPSRTELLLQALLALAVADRESRLTNVEPPRTEVILARAGLSLAEISSTTGKGYEAVKKAVQRAKPKGLDRGEEG